MTILTGFERPPFSTVLVTAVRHKLCSILKRQTLRRRKRHRVQPPADFAQAIAEVLTPDRVPSVRNMADTDTSLASEPGYAECREFAV